MLLSHIVVGMLSVGAMVLGASGVAGQNYPNKPIRIVTGGVGGSADFTSRVIAQGISGSLGQQVIVDNRPSAVIPGEIVSKAAPDGYTLLLHGPPLWIGAILEKLPYDPVRDFSPITSPIRQLSILVVHPSLPVKSVKELIVLAKAKPGVLNYASVATGSPTHLAAELFKAMAGVDIMRINYKSAAEVISDLIGGQVQLMFASTVAVAPHVKSGKLTALAVTSAEPSALFPGLPTVAASGLPGYESVMPFGVFAPAGTPGAIVNRLNREIVGVVSRADVKEKFFNVGGDIVGSSPDALAAFVKSEMSRMGKVIKDAGIRAD